MDGAENAVIINDIDIEPHYTSDFKLKVLPHLDDIYEWLKQGMTEYSISEQLGIHYNTFTQYKQKYNEIRELYTRATKERNRLVMNRMFSKACGETAVVEQEKLDRQGNKVKLKSEIYVPPDVNAADLYLRNNDENYKSAKNDQGNLTLIQNNFQLPDLQQQLLQIDRELKKLEMPDTLRLEESKD
jgi:hypothetical protein